MIELRTHVYTRGDGLDQGQTTAHSPEDPNDAYRRVVRRWGGGLPE
jgi:hypothetical protein